MLPHRVEENGVSFLVMGVSCVVMGVSCLVMRCVVYALTRDDLDIEMLSSWIGS